MVIVVVIAVAVGFFLYSGQHGNTTTAKSAQWRILYVNQGNGYVGENNFSLLIAMTKSHNFNTIFFQVYRSGSLLYTTDQMKYFITSAHDSNVSIFFALFFTEASDQIPTTIFTLGENGLSLDMSTLTTSAQSSIFSEVKSAYTQGKIAITTTDFSISLHPDLLILETYQEPQDEQYIHPGIIAGVEVLATQNNQDYNQQVQYARDHSDGVMVFDLYGLLRTGY